MLESIYEDPFKYPGVEIVRVPTQDEDLDDDPFKLLKPQPKPDLTKFSVNLPKWEMPTSKPSSTSSSTSSSSTAPTATSSRGTSNRAENLRTFIKTFEGGYANVPGDSGGPTKAGVTLGTWQSLGHDKNGDGVIDARDVKLLQDSDQAHVFKNVWDTCKADQIQDTSIANILVDWAWGSGPTGIKRARLALGLPGGLQVDSRMLNALNNGDRRATFEKLKKAREQHFREIVQKHPEKRKFLKGWLRRNNSINYGSLIGSNNVEYFK